VLGYTLYRNVIPFPEGTARVMPLAAIIWLLGALVFVLVRADLTRRAGERLTAAEGLAPADEVSAGKSL
jgi:hypothetical protein